MTIHTLNGKQPVEPVRRLDAYLDGFYAEWRRAEHEHDKLSFDDATLDAAVHRVDEALTAFTRAEAQTFQGLLIKLKIAFDYEDFYDTAIDRTRRLVTPRVLVSLLRDLEHLASAERDKEIVGGAS